MNQSEYFRNNPPRCISDFISKPTALPGAEFDDHLSLSQLESNIPSGVKIDAPEYSNPVFSLSCNCGGQRHFVHCYRWINPDFHNAVVFLSPIVLECAACKKTTELFDTDKHGYDGELGHGSASARAEGDRVVFECPKCGREPFSIFVRFELPDDLFDGDFPEFVGREQDLFTWFFVLGTCAKCSQLKDIADFESA